MPKSTFYRLPEEKKNRILEAAKQEFFRVSYQEASINKIIKNAEIPRGSFYQYFEDKQDVFFFVISEYYEIMLQGVFLKLDSMQGDFFRFIDYYIDRIQQFSESGEYGKMMLNLVNQETSQMICDMVRDQKLYDKAMHDMEHNVRKRIDYSLLSIVPEEEEHLFHVVGAVMRDGMHQIICQKDPENVKHVCKNLHQRMTFLQKHFAREKANL